MSALLLPLSILCGLILCGTAISLFAVYRAHCLLREMNERTGNTQSQSNAEFQALRDTVDALAAQIHDLQNHPPVAPPPGLLKPGLNLSKRSHALRMHRPCSDRSKSTATVKCRRAGARCCLLLQRAFRSSGLPDRDQFRSG